APLEGTGIATVVNNANYNGVGDTAAAYGGTPFGGPFNAPAPGGEGAGRQTGPAKDGPGRARIPGPPRLVVHPTILLPTRPARPGARRTGGALAGRARAGERGERVRAGGARPAVQPGAANGGGEIRRRPARQRHGPDRRRDRRLRRADAGARGCAPDHEEKRP